jgi:small subunit ribosomal protein S11
MGKKRIKKVKTEEEILKEKEKVEAALSKATRTEGLISRVSKKIENVRIYINASYNNTALSVTDRQGNVVAWSSAGSLGFSGPKKATPFAASRVAAAIGEKLKKLGPLNAEVIIKGVGSGRDSAIRSLANQGLNILSIKDITPIPHNGPRPPKVRRV